MPAKSLFFEPMVCDKAEQPPEGLEWLYELKLHGYRAIGFRSEGWARLWSRNGTDFVRRFSKVANAIENLPEDTAIDGEIVALDPDGKPSFGLLQGSGAWRGAGCLLCYREGTCDSLDWKSDASACAKSSTSCRKTSGTPRRSPSQRRRSCGWSARMDSKASSRNGRAVGTVRAARATGSRGARIVDRRLVIGGYMPRIEPVRFAAGRLLRRPRFCLRRTHSSGSGGLQVSAALSFRRLEC
jgi:hypothetical protein